MPGSGVIGYMRCPDGDQHAQAERIVVAVVIELDLSIGALLALASSLQVQKLSFL